MKPAQMDADLVKISDPQQLGLRLSYWETRQALSRLSDDDLRECQQIAIRHAQRVVKVMRAG